MCGVRCGAVEQVMLICVWSTLWCGGAGGVDMCVEYVVVRWSNSKNGALVIVQCYRLRVVV